jgi:hypothetical protein
LLSSHGVNRRCLLHNFELYLQKHTNSFQLFWPHVQLIIWMYGTTIIWVALALLDMKWKFIDNFVKVSSQKLCTQRGHTCKLSFLHITCGLISISHSDQQRLRHLNHANSTRHTMSAKDCGNHGSYWGDRKFYRRFCGCIFFLLIIAGIVILLVWLLLRPTKPTFSLQDLSVLNLTLSNSDQSYNFTVVTAMLQLTLSSHNPNSNIGVYYDRLHTFASYRYLDQFWPITQSSQQ